MAAFLPADSANQLAMASIETIVLCFNESGWHSPSTSPNQLGLQFVPRQKIELAVVTRSGPKGKNWSTEKDIKDYLLDWNSCRIRDTYVVEQADLTGTKQVLDQLRGAKQQMEQTGMIKDDYNIYIYIYIYI